jgi:hypothetical protein
MGGGRLSVRKWAWAGASCRGISHVKAGTRGQDAFSAFTVCDGSTFVTIVSDGAGSASHGGEGAALLCRTLATRLRAHFRSDADLPSEELLWSWLDHARDRIALAAERRGLTMRDFAATLVLTITDGSSSLVAHVGDGSSVVRERDGGTWRALSWPVQGQYASTTVFVTDDELQMRVARSDTAIDAVATFTDGIERLALDFGAEQPHQPFFRGIILPLEESAGQGADRVLAPKLAAYLDSDAINARTDDDKTLVLAVLR